MRLRKRPEFHIEEFGLIGLDDDGPTIQRAIDAAGPVNGGVLFSHLELNVKSSLDGRCHRAALIMPDLHPDGSTSPCSSPHRRSHQRNGYPLAFLRLGRGLQITNIDFYTADTWRVEQSLRLRFLRWLKVQKRKRSRR